jgi:hypothetical protein
MLLSLYRRRVRAVLFVPVPFAMLVGLACLNAWYLTAARGIFRRSSSVQGRPDVERLALFQRATQARPRLGVSGSRWPTPSIEASGADVIRSAGWRPSSARSLRCSHDDDYTHWFRSFRSRSTSSGSGGRGYGGASGHHSGSDSW